MFLTYTERINRTENDINSMLKWMYDEIERKNGSTKVWTTNLGDVASVVKLKEVPCGIYGKYVKLNGIIKLHNSASNITEYKIRGFIIGTNSYYNYEFRQIPLDVKAKIVDRFSKEMKEMKEV